MALDPLPYLSGSVTEVQIGVVLGLLMLQKRVSWAGLMTVVLLYVEVGGLSQWLWPACEMLPF